MLMPDLVDFLTWRHDPCTAKGEEAEAAIFRHRAAGNGFGFTVIDHQSLKVPTILRSYWKVNCGPFVACEGGVRMLRVPEIERLMGFVPRKGFTSRSYSTAVEILGQGVQTRIFRQLIGQLGDFLEHMLKTGRVPAPPKQRLFN